MTARKKLLLAAAGVVIAAAAAFAVWYHIPKRFLKGVWPSEIREITVYSGQDGGICSLNDSERIAEILTELQNTPMQRNELSVSCGISTYSLAFKGVGEELELTVFPGMTELQPSDELFTYRSTGSGFYELIDGIYRSLPPGDPCWVRKSW